jgi:hypothetical protein
VQASLAVEGISKDRKNDAQGYKFRGIDDVYNALAPLLAKNGLCILPRCTERTVVERINAKGTALFYVTVRADFDFVSSEDGSKHTITTYGEAMDSGDKATNKAMSAAYKYAAMQAFAIPTEGDNDADGHTHTVAPSLVPILEASIEQARQKRAGVIGAVLADIHLPAGVEIALNSLAEKVTPDAAGFDLVEEQGLNSDEKTYLWSLLNSKVRSALKREKDIRALTKETA